MATLKVTEQVTREVEVELPFYFHHDLSEYRTHVYGRVDENGCIKVEFSQNDDDGTTVEISYDDNGPNAYTCYLKPIHKSDAEEFDHQARRAKKLIGQMFELAGLPCEQD